jgi:peptidoglycan/LPS O-acetylase OafA/YrhL
VDVERTVGPHVRLAKAIVGAGGGLIGKRESLDRLSTPRATTRHTFRRRFLSLTVLRWFGRISYSLYLWHLPVLVAFKYAPFHADHQMLGVLLSIVMASASYYGIERPALGIKGYFQPSSVLASATDRTVV